MKKVIALALVLVMALSMATVAFAADPYVDSGVPGKKYTIPFSAFKNGVNTPKETYFTSDYFTVSYKVDKGAALLDSVKFDDEGNIVVKFKDNYTLEKPAIPNFKFKELKVKSKKDAKYAAIPVGAADDKLKKNVEFEATTYYGDFTVGYAKNDTNLDNVGTIANGTYYKFVKNNGVSFADISFSSGLAYVDLRVFDGDKIYFEVDPAANIDVVKANPDADLDFVDFVGHPKLSSSASVEINADKGEFLYEIKDGKLVKSNWKYDEEGGVFKGKTTTLGSYVVSDIELKNAASSADDTTKNPNTGANDVVGVAVALAVVSLVAAGAVSLKK